MNEQCDSIREKMSAMLSGDLPADLARSIEKHAGKCPACRVFLQALRQDDQLLTDYVRSLDSTVARVRVAAIESLNQAEPLSAIPMWQAIARSRITHIAAAVVIVMLLGTGYLVFSRDGAKPAWTVEQTIEALKTTSSIHMSGIARLPTNPPTTQECELWATPVKDGSRGGDLRFKLKDGAFALAKESENVTYRYEPSSNTVQVMDGVLECIWLEGDALRLMRDRMDTWQETYAKDPETGRDCVIVTCSVKLGSFQASGQTGMFPSAQYVGWSVSGGSEKPGGDPGNARSWWMQFDLETKLPVRGKQWSNDRWEGTPDLDVTRMNYNPELPEGIFELKAPQGAMVVDMRGKPSGSPSLAADTPRE